ncbi:MAG: type IV secretion system DNA-binding domain-containing protein, partial [Pseudomonadota bacterium]|nr:type IV secretion system DNA-binding domain-containing protein [Pseudomonadota bacterium]
MGIIAFALTLLLIDFAVVNGVAQILYETVFEDTGLQDTLPLAFIINPCFALWLSLFSILLVVSVVFTSFKSSKSDINYSSGIVLLTGNVAKSHARKVASKDGSAVEVLAHPDIPLTSKMLAGNVFVAGKQSSGKSTVIKSLLRQLAKTDHKLFIYDLKKEYSPYVDHNKLLCLSLERDAPLQWDISKDIKQDSDAASVSIALVEEETGKDSFFTDSAREVVKGVLLSLLQRNKPWGWRDLYERLFATHEQLHCLLANAYPPAGVLIEENNKTTQSIRSVISTKLGWMKHVAEWSKSSKHRFSI